MAEEPEEREVEVAFELPVELRAGVYANNVNVWSSPDEFTLDFCVAERPEPTDPDDPSSPLQMVYLGVSRIRIPVTLIFGVMRALNEAMTAYESVLGEIKRPEVE